MFLLCIDFSLCRMFLLFWDERHYPDPLWQLSFRGLLERLLAAILPLRAMEILLPLAP